MPSRANAIRDAFPVAIAVKISLTSTRAFPSQRPRARVMTPFRGLVIGEVDELVLGKAGVQRDIHQSSKALGPDFRNSGNRGGIEDAVTNDAQAAGTLRDEDTAIRRTPC